MSSSSAPEFTELNARRLGPVRRYFVRHPVAMDLLVMAWFGIPSFLTVVLVPEGTPRGVVVGAIASVLATAALWFRRRRPLATLAVVTVLGVVTTVAMSQTAGFELAVALGVYAVAASRPAHVAWLALGASVATLGTTQVLVDAPTNLEAVAAASPDPTDWDVFRVTSVTAIVLWAVIALAIGIGVRNRRLHIGALIDRANQLALERDQREQLAVAAERARIAREMHDVVAHSLSVMITLADGAQAILEKSPDRARTAMDDVAETGRSALGDMRRVLGALRDDEATGAMLEPQPTEGIGELVDRFRAAGLPVHLTTSGVALPADAGLRLAVYRILQEALTNVLRYAPLAPWIEAAVATTPDGVVVRVSNGGGSIPGEGRQGSGKGLIGMRERVAVFGGSIEAGPTLSGWQVRALLPWREDEV
ncbi:histidine kinase [Beutenbergia cavernae DSM 12333]|uniref:histidine kinase n=1 Tax=Beutenbergia cavernae (strain ATCC BAA-8 / DSM 12333 / CCUG 43141 / JCM 11478 / NBRC 16432 / NCIMB 13614 / HKI 0122) TaxID=471853 RepID=C5C0C5_BEUC1|nr:histidine kinase [Beutenbergia cavernae]ACQ79311.1 histidine kinase [Beutenbergia cavernae DSM 12333]